MSAEQKALRACADYARLNAEIRRLTRALSDSLSKCPGQSGYLLNTNAGLCAEQEADCTHLKVAYTPEVEEGFYDRSQVFMTDAEIREYLAVCPHCLATHQAIQDRKAARRSLGAAKRSISMIGRATNKEPA